MREPQLLVQPHQRLNAQRTPARSKPTPTQRNEWWGIDMTKVLVGGFGWVSSVIVLDWYSKRVVGYEAGLPCTPQDWLAALDIAVKQQFPNMGPAIKVCPSCVTMTVNRGRAPAWRPIVPWGSSKS
jgi:putative transposase